MSRPPPVRVELAHVELYLRLVQAPPSPSNAEECWGWTGPVTDDGYPRVRPAPSTGVRETQANRVAWTLAHPGTPVPDAVLTTCCVRTCTNPRHLRAGRRRGQPPAFFGRNPYPART